MPIKRRLKRTRPASSSELARLLHNEWQNPTKRGQPLIVIEGGKSEPIHLYVIWDMWNDLSQADRSEIIMDVVENLTGEAALPPDSPVTVAMGLTSDEARRMGIKAS